MDDRPEGLTSAEAARRLAESGPNIIFAPSHVTFLDILWEEVREPMIVLLLVVGVLYSILGKPTDAITIFVIILLLTLAEVQNEYRAKRSIDRLSAMASPQAAVVRDGRVTHIDAVDVVVGDTLVLAAGTKIAADATVSQALGLQIDESALTGESLPVEKSTGESVYADTIVLAGSATAQVTATAGQTKIGELAEGLKTVKPPKTPLQKAMKELSGKLVWVAVGFSIVIPLIGVLRGKPLNEMILTGLSLSFATIPEEMPIIVTMVLGLGSYRLSKQNFLVKRLQAAETMGAVDVIVTDKTGTLTESKMTLSRIYPATDEREAITAAMGAISPVDATFIDMAIRRRAEQMGIGLDPRQILRRRELGEGEKTKAVLRNDGSLYVSGAPEEVLEKCAAVPAEVRDALLRDAADARRLVAVATGRVGEGERDAKWETLERDLEFAGLLSFEDPPRKEVPTAIAAMSRAGVRTIMVTGDHPATASAIAREVGIGQGDGEVITGPELDEKSDSELDGIVGRVQVFARTTPQHKYRIVEALQRRGLKVAVTGDGINDSLAIKGADIGIAMGIRGTDVAKDVADAIVADDNYATITTAIFEGRVFYDNLRKGVKYYLSVKLALIAVFLLPALFGLPLPFSPVQIILLELFMDLAASAGFVAEPAEPDIHTRGPEKVTRRILDGPQLRDIALKGFFLFAAVMAAYYWAGAQGWSEIQRSSLAFTAWMIGHVALAFVSRSDRQPLARVGVFANKVVSLWALATAVFICVALYVPAISAQLKLVWLPPSTVGVVALLTIMWMSLLEVRKWVRRSGA
ncbi:MAG: cation-transporting P-type ATPase [Actinomycetia bacterium]|nr:cation-transporting P-type ATPase [Actinomycetes bacterium]